MKKTFILILLAAVGLFGCAKPEVEIPAGEEVEYNATLTATIPTTKVTIDDAYTKLVWNKGDKISVLTSSGAYREFVYDGEDGATSAEFKGNLIGSETITDWAVYPAHESHTIYNGRPKIYLPNEYQWEEGKVMGPMVAAVTDAEASFTHAGGLFAFDVYNVPVGTTGFRFVAHTKDISGEYTYQDNNTVYAPEDEDGSYVEMLFDALTAPRDMKFYIPVPTATYESFTIYYRTAEGEYKTIRKSNTPNMVNAATVKVFTVSIEGGAWYVTETGSAEADGLSWANATTLSTALSKAEDGDVIYVGAGTYVPDSFIYGHEFTVDDSNVTTIAEEASYATADAHKAFIIDKNVTILGGYPAAGGSICNPETNATVLDGNSVSNHVVIVSAPKAADAKVRMSGFTVKGAVSENVKGGWKINENLLDNYTGAFAVVGSSVALSDMEFTGNGTVNASALYGVNSVVDIKDCAFTANTASSNGTVWFTDGSELTFADSEISGNTANNAAGLYLYLSSGKTMTANVSDVTITDNTSVDRGAVYLRTAADGQTLNATLDGCTISNNTGANGAGINILGASGLTIRNTEISGNTASTNGGGVYATINKNGTVGTTLANIFDGCTVSGNGAKAGGGIYYLDISGSVVRNTEISENSGTALGGALYSLGTSSKYENCKFLSNTSTANGTFLIQSDDVETTNIFDKCVWNGNHTAAQANLMLYTTKTYANNIVVSNSLFSNNSCDNGRGGAVQARTSGAGGVDFKCVNTTFYGNSSTNQGLAVNIYSGDANNIANVELISCTITGHVSTKAHSAVYAENAGAQVTLYNSLIANNVGIHADGRTLDTYNVHSGTDGKITRYNCQNGTTYYGDDGKNAGANSFTYATMLGALNADGVCPLLLPDSNPAFTGGMSPAALAALASDNVPASVLTVDQLGNERTGTVIGAWAATAAASDL